MVLRALGWFSLAVLGVVMFVLAIRIRVTYGPSVVFVVGSVLGAAWAATKASREQVEDFLSALRDVAMKLETAAYEMRMVLPQLSRQVNHVEQLSASRIAELEERYPDFARAYGRRRLERAGGCVVIDDERIARILAKVDGAPVSSLRVVA